MEFGAIISYKDLAGADTQVADFIGKKVALKPGFIYGIIEAIKLGTDPHVKISGDWYSFKKHHLVMLSDD